MAESLFTTQTPALPNVDPGHALTVGIVIVPGVAGQVTHGRWYFPTPLPSGSVAFVLYDAVTQAELSRATFTGPTAGAWNMVALSAPVSVTAGQRLIAAVYTPTYVATGGFFNSAGLTNGNLSAPATGSDPIGNGRFTDPGDAYPATTFNGNCYFVDVVFNASGGGGASVAPSGVAVPVALGAPTLAWSGSVAPDGIAASVSLGSPTASAQSIAAPDGVAVPVALGSPSLVWSAGVSPDGLSVPVAVGAPIVGAASVDPDGIAVAVGVGDPALTWSSAIGPVGIAVPVVLGAPMIDVAPLAPVGLSVSVALGPPLLGWSGAVSPDGIFVPAVIGSPGLNIPGGVVTRPDFGVVTRSNLGVTVRPAAGFVTRPASGIVTRPDVGVVSRL